MIPGIVVPRNIQIVRELQGLVVLLILYFFGNFIFFQDRQYTEDIRRQKDVSRLLTKVRDVYSQAQLMQKVFFFYFFWHILNVQKFSNFF